MKRCTYVVLVVLLIVPVIGCSSSKSGEMEDMIKNLPVGLNGYNYFFFTDFEKLKGDDDMEAILVKADDPVEYWMDKLGIDIDTVNSLVWYGYNNLLYGNFNLDDIREELVNLGYDADDYNGVEVWGKYGDAWVAIMSGLIIMGTEDEVKDCIDVIKDGNDSILDDKDCKDVIDRLPNGPLMVYWIVGEASTYKAVAHATNKKDDETLTETMIYKFDDENAVDNTLDDILEAIDAQGLNNIDVEQDGEFLTVSAEITIDDYILEIESS